MRVLLGVTGSIASFKSPALCRLLVKQGIDLRVVMSESAKAFVTPLTLSTLSKHPVISDLYNPRDGSWVNHVELGMWADVFCIAPLSANTLGKMANGICDNAIMSIYLSAKCDVVVAPAMDKDMYLHPSTQRNIEQLRKDKVKVIDPKEGELASGIYGIGRMAEPEEIANFLTTHYKL